MFEYRTLSSAMMSSKELLELIYNQVVNATQAFNNGLNLPDATYVQVAINNSDVKLANDLINSYNILSNTKKMYTCETVTMDNDINYGINLGLPFA